MRGSTFGYFDIISTIRNFGAKNLFTFRFYLPTGKTLNAYNNAANPGRIFIEFSTINEFTQDLGFPGLVTGNYLPCHFGTDFPAGGTPRCILRKSEVADTYAVIEIVDFPDIPDKASGMITFKIYGITNPTTTAGNFALINMRFR